MSEYRSMMDELQSVRDSMIEAISKEIEERILEKTEYLANNPKAYSIRELKIIMLAKAGNIKMKVHPEVFLQIADKLNKLENLVTMIETLKHRSRIDLSEGQDGG